ncbi:hypothetical protein N0V90_007631 [Kalmusia sp. IMI 367209]|nr:hypothetical protein N0V90_007631 [Kalmusia sp. IMI 367209]
MRLKTLNGAPLCADLDFSPEALLHPDEAAHFLRPDALPTANGEDLAFKWRHITPKEHRLRSDWSQPYLPNGGFHGDDLDISFSVPGIGASLDGNQQDLTILDTTMSLPEATFEDNDFVHQSLILHDTLLSSQIASEEVADRTVSSQSFLGTSFDSTGTDSFQHSDTSRPILQVPTTLKLTTLGSLPDAAHLRSLYPQTPTPNLLCVLAAPPETREVFVKKGSYKMQLREIVVADDTRSGFKISFWQRPSNGSNSRNALDQALQCVKVGDILLLRNIALNPFRDDVYGQSLNPSITRVRTSIELLMSGSVISTRQLGALPAPVLTAFTRLKKWANIHVASDLGSAKRRRRATDGSSRSPKRTLRSTDVHDETLPPDTMEPT